MLNALAFLRADPKLALYGLLIAFGSSFGQTFFISQFGGVFRAEFGLGDGAFGSIYGAATLLSAAVIIHSGALIDRIDLRRWTVGLIVCFACACAFVGLVNGPVGLFFAIFLLRQFGQGLMSHTMGTSIARYHDVMRGKALAFGSYGYPLGEAFLPILGVAVMQAVGWRDAWFLFALALLLLWLPLARILLTGHTRRHGDHLRRTGIDPANPLGAATAVPEQAKIIEAGGGPALGQWRRRQVLGDRRFYLALPGTLAPSMIITALFLHGVKVAEMKGWSHELWAASLALYALASLPASLLFGAWIDRHGALSGLNWFLIPLVFACVILALGEAPATAWLFMAVAGLTAGMIAVLQVALWAELYGTRHLGEIKALTTALMVFSSAAGPPIMGLMLDMGLSLAMICLFFAVLAGIGCLLSVLAQRAYRRTSTPPNS